MAYLFYRLGHPVFSNASCLFGWHLEREEMYTALLFVPKNSVLLFDESSAHLSSRVGHGVAVSSFAESNLNTRKKNCIMVYMSAHDWEIAPAIRRNCREVWMPVSGDDLEIEAVSSTKGSRVLPANNPDNFRMAWHVWDDYPYRKANLIEGESYRLKQSRLAATTRSAGDFPELHEAVRDALRLGAVSFDAVKHLVLCRVEGRPQRLDLELCWRSFSRPTWKGYPQGGWMTWSRPWGVRVSPRARCRVSVRSWTWWWMASWANPAEPGPKFPPGPETVNSSLPDSILPSEVQIAQSLAQSVVAGSTMLTVPSSSTMPGVSAINVPPACAVPSDQATSFNMRAPDPMNANPLLFRVGTVRSCRSPSRLPWSR